MLLSVVIEDLILSNFYRVSYRQNWRRDFWRLRQKHQRKQTSEGNKPNESTSGQDTVVWLIDKRHSCPKPKWSGNDLKHLCLARHLLVRTWIHIKHRITFVILQGLASIHDDEGWDCVVLSYRIRFVIYVTTLHAICTKCPECTSERVCTALNESFCRCVLHATMCRNTAAKLKMNSILL